MAIFIKDKYNSRPRVFLGGTCNNSKWRNDIIPMLENINMDYFNPIVDNWDEQAQKEELLQRKICDIVLYTITSEMTGVYSIAEVTDDSNKNPSKTILCILYDGFEDNQKESLHAVADLVQRNGASVTDSLDGIIKIIKEKI